MLALGFDGGVDAAGVELEPVELVRRVVGEGAVCGGADLEGALDAVMLKEGGTEDFGELAGDVAAEGVHLPEAVLRGDVALGDDEVVERGGSNVGNTVGVALDDDGCGEAGDGELGMTMYRTLRPDVVVLDLRLPRVSGFDVIIQLRKEFPTARIVVLSNYQGSEDIYRAVRSGAMAYLTKDASGEELLSAIQNVDRGLRYLPHVALDRLAERMPTVELTPRETEVLACITQGRSNREIAEDLHIAEKTVRIHVSSVLDKMGARDRTQATIYALQRGIVHLE